MSCSHSMTSGGTIEDLIECITEDSSLEVLMTAIAVILWDLEYTIREEIIAVM